jgi:hypothetical protein
LGDTALPAEIDSCGRVPVASLRQVPTAQPSRPELHPVSGDRFSLRVSLDAATKRQLDDLRALLAHNIPNGDLAAVVKEAIACAIEKHGKRKGAVAPDTRAATARKARSMTSDRERNTSCNANAADDGRSATPAAVASSGLSLATRSPRRFPEAARPSSSAIPLPIRRQVWERDGGGCAWTAPDGTRCSSRWKLELDHVWPRALGGASTVDNLRISCRAHNVLHAEQVLGREHVEGCRGANAAARGRRASLVRVPTG